MMVGRPVVFSNVLTNVGGAYDHVTGFFTTPHNGLYSFRYIYKSSPWSSYDRIWCPRLYNII
jgi:hypothetical protein